ncbi:hypothetical protein QYF36_002935 [Acer negundo]|nr:hypothetical protein QYF36_002935 [Acer negundo]
MFTDLPNFKNVTYLYMDYSSVDINVLQIVGEMTSLEFISLSNCGLQGTLVHQGQCKFVHLQELYLSRNNLMGTLPSCFANLTSLRVLDISSNKFTGDISLSPIKALISIQELRLSNNHFQIPLSLAPLFNLSKLKKFYGENNEIIFAETESHSSAPKFQLNTIMLSCCGDGGKLPEFLHYQHDLQKVDLSHNNLTGEFPNWLLDNNTKLEYLVLANNSLAGLLQFPNHSLMGLTTLNLSHNLFRGHIPKEIGEYLPSLISLNLSRNAFDGSIPSSIGDMDLLESLDLSFNQLSGKIPEHLAKGCTSLRLLVLSNNSIQGQIFSSNFSLTNLLRLQLDSNNFTGRIPDSLSKASNLAGLYLSDNKISGGIPSWLGTISSLEDIIMPNNHLEGPIPLEFCRLNNLEVLDLTGNNYISGSLPSCFSPPSITQVHLSKNRLDGQLKEAFYNSSSLVTLDLGHNRLDGSIPTWIGRLTHLTYLTLSNNNFEGEVPTQLCKLKQLRLVDISHNNLYGHLPPCLDVTALHDIVPPSSISMPPVGSISMPPTEGPNSGPPMRKEDTVEFRINDNAYSSPPMGKEETVEFRTKNNSYFYQGKVLTGMSGIDLSCNKLTGLIPQQIGNLTGIRTLNLSHNNFTGPIPPTFARLRQIESLDLSYNNLNGKIPPQLIELYTLSFFSVAHNNLSGNIPKSTQFCTYGDDGFEGNPFLYGLPLSKSCDTTTSPSSPMPRASTDNGEDNDLMDIFYISFTVSYIIVLLGIAAVLYINPYWRRSWFYLVETRMTSCYHYVADNLPHRLRH